MSPCEVTKVGVETFRQKSALHILWILLWFLLRLESAAGSAHAPPIHPDDCPTCPYFVSTKTNIQSSVGIPANLTCGVRNIGDWEVSWIRRRDLHVLTAGSLLYTNDKRFKVHHVDQSPYWTLEFLYPSVSDAGSYECQVSTQPKIHKSFNLHVSVPEARIAGSQEFFMDAGSDINITCIVTGHTNQIHVVWYHTLPQKFNGSTEEINQGGRGGIQVVTDRYGGTSSILVRNATHRDSGNYTCAPDYATPAVVSVHIIEEERPAAMQPEISESTSTNLHRTLFILSVFVSMAALR